MLPHRHYVWKTEEGEPRRSLIFLNIEDYQFESETFLRQLLIDIATLKRQDANRYVPGERVRLGYGDFEFDHQMALLDIGWTEPIDDRYGTTSVATLIGQLAGASQEWSRDRDDLREVLEELQGVPQLFVGA
jgi:hypothetical protein